MRSSSSPDSSSRPAPLPRPTLTAMAAAGAVSVTGDKALAQRFIDLYALPPKAGSSTPYFSP